MSTSERLGGAVSSILITVVSIVRGLPLFMSARPKTPLRVLCIMAFDTLYMLRNSQRLSMHQLRVLAALLDFGAAANAALDAKDYCRHEYRATLQLLDEAGIRSTVDEYLQRLRNLEIARPLPSADYWQFYEARVYREAVVRLSLGIVATTANVRPGLDDAIHATHADAELNLLYRIVMQCQIVDDVLDFPQDLSAGLPGFLTACSSLSQALELTRLASMDYADDRDLPRTGENLPLRSALWLVSTGTRLVLWLGSWRRHARSERGFASGLDGLPAVSNGATMASDRAASIG